MRGELRRTGAALPLVPIYSIRSPRDTVIPSSRPSAYDLIELEIGAHRVIRGRTLCAVGGSLALAGRAYGDIRLLLRTGPESGSALAVQLPIGPAPLPLPSALCESSLSARQHAQLPRNLVHHPPAPRFCNSFTRGNPHRPGNKSCKSMRRLRVISFGGILRTPGICPAMPAGLLPNEDPRDARVGRWCRGRDRGCNDKGR